jgi:hypothetical protein
VAPSANAGLVSRIAAGAAGSGSAAFSPPPQAASAGARASSANDGRTGGVSPPRPVGFATVSGVLASIRFYDVVLWIHITAVVTAFGPLFAYPIFLAVNARAPLAERATFHRSQIAFSKRVTGPVIGIILLAGIYLASDADVWSKAWVTVPFIAIFVIAGLGATVLRRAEEGMEAASVAGDESAYAAALSTARTWTAATLALIVIVIFFMTAKPFA